MKKILAPLFFLLTLALLPSANAQLLYNEGEDYFSLQNPLPLNKDGQSEVVEFFSFTCPHCSNLDPAIKRWASNKKSDDVGFYQVHATGGAWDFPARVKYVAVKLGLGHDFDEAYFAEVHQKRNRRVAGDKDTAIAFIAKHGNLEIEAVEKAWDSLQVRGSLKRSRQLLAQADLQSVPAVVVNGKYLVKLTEYDRLFDVIEFLLATKKVDGS